MAWSRNGVFYVDAGQTKITILLFTSFYLTKDSTGVDLAAQNWTELAGFCDFVSDDLGVLSLIQKPCGRELEFLFPDSIFLWLCYCRP